MSSPVLNGGDSSAEANAVPYAEDTVSIVSRKIFPAELTCYLGGAGGYVPMRGNLGTIGWT